MTNQQKTPPVSALFQKQSERERANAPVAVMDSGAGGICVLRRIRALLPREDLLYFGDSANAPYGERSRDEVRALVMGHAERLLEKAKALVLACNTATALAIEALRSAYPDTPIVGMEPAIRPALSVCEHPRILVLATEITLQGARFASLCSGHKGEAEILPVCAPEIVRLVETGRAESEEMLHYVEGVLAPYRHPRPDAVVLGCTHFPFAKKAICAVLGEGVPIFDGAEGTARQLARTLEAQGLLNQSPKRGAVTLTSSGERMLPLYAGLLFTQE